MSDWCRKWGRLGIDDIVSRQIGNSCLLISLFLILAVVSASGQDDDIQAKASTYSSIGLSMRAAGARTLGFYSFQGAVPELVVHLALFDWLHVGGAIRYSSRSSELAKTTIWDPSVHVLLTLGRSRRTFVEARLRRAVVRTSWRTPLTGTDSHDTSGFSCGLGHNVKLTSRIALRPILFYEFLRSEDGLWRGGSNIDLGLHYQLGK